MGVRVRVKVRLSVRVGDRAKAKARVWVEVLRQRSPTHFCPPLRPSGAEKVRTPRAKSCA